MSIAATPYLTYKGSISNFSQHQPDMIVQMAKEQIADNKRRGLFLKDTTLFAHLLLGEKAEERGDYSEALRHYSVVRYLDPFDLALDAPVTRDYMFDLQGKTFAKWQELMRNPKAAECAATAGEKALEEVESCSLKVAESPDFHRIEIVSTTADNSTLIELLRKGTGKKSEIRTHCTIITFFLQLNLFSDVIPYMWFFYSDANKNFQNQFSSFFDELPLYIDSANPELYQEQAKAWFLKNIFGMVTIKSPQTIYFTKETLINLQKVRAFLRLQLDKWSLEAYKAWYAHCTPPIGGETVDAELTNLKKRFEFEQWEYLRESNSKPTSSTVADLDSGTDPEERSYSQIFAQYRAIFMGFASLFEGENLQQTEVQKILTDTEGKILQLSSDFSPSEKKKLETLLNKMIDVELTWKVKNSQRFENVQTTKARICGLLQGSSSQIAND
jgi:hypothetical protein